MTRKQIAIPVILLISLAGCRDRKRKKAHRSDAQAAIVLPKIDGRSASEVGNNDILSFFDDNVDGYAFDNDDNDSINLAVADDARSAWVSDDNEGAISWIESAYEKNGLQTIYFGFNKYGITKDQRAIVEADAQAV